MGRNRNAFDRSPSWAGRLLTAGFYAALALTAPMLCAEDIQIEIQGSNRGGERFEMTFNVLIPDRPVRDNEAGYSPAVLGASGEPFTVTYQTPLELTWQFGDGSSVATGDQVSVSHRYSDDGTYTVTVVARDAAGEFARATREVKVVNNDPADLRIAASVVDPAQNIVELSGWAEEVDGDPMQFQWDFGDGDSAQGSADEIWWTRHQYVAPGRYEVTLTVTDDDYPSTSGSSDRNDGRAEKKIKVTVGGGGTATVSGADEPDGSSTEASLTNHLNVTTSGTVNSEFNAEVRPFAGLYLSQVKSGACRFMFTAWDNTNLVSAMAVLDLHGVPPEGGRFRINRPQFALDFQPDGASYIATKNSRPDPFGESGVAGLVQRTLDRAMAPDGSALTDEQRDAVTDRLTDLTGIRSQERVPGNQAVPSAQSPFVEEQIGFRTVDGSLVLDFIPGDRAVGHFDVTMEAGFGPYRGQQIQVNADIALDMEAAASDGIVRYEGCEPPPFEITKVHPDDGFQHVFSRQPPVKVSFSERVDPATLDAQSVQIAFVDTSGTLVPVPIRIMRDDRSVIAVPSQPLLPGVIYTVRVKTGSDGVRSRAGSPLDSSNSNVTSVSDSDGIVWSTSHFTTRIDMVPLTDERRLLACHVYQPARDVPLIVGKPAVTRIFANWEAQPGVHPDHQVKEFIGTVELYGSDNSVLSRELHTFVRPDLWQERGINLTSAEQSAQLKFTPDATAANGLLAAIKVKTSPKWDPMIQYQARCPTMLWDRQPSLSIDFVALRFDEWKDHPERLDALLPTLQRVANESVDYAMQQFPLSAITASDVRIVEPDFDVLPLHPEGTSPDFKCGAGCILGGHEYAEAIFGVVYWTTEYPSVKDWLRSQSSADVVIAFGPHDRLGGGETVANLGDGRGIVLVLGGDSAEYFPRYVNGAVHELGHVLSLQHIPYVISDADRALVLPLRDASTDFEYEGIEAMRISLDGHSVWNKSSTDGNEQGDRLFPLMFPGTIPTDEAFIANHQYRAIQRYLDDLDFD